MTYKTYSKLQGTRESAITRKRSLLMIIRMNEAWEHIGKGSNSKRYQDRQNKLLQARRDLASLIIPPKPEQPIGYEIYIDGDYEYYDPTSNYNDAISKAIDHQTFGDLPQGKVTLKETPRWRD